MQVEVAVSAMESHAVAKTILTKNLRNQGPNPIDPQRESVAHFSPLVNMVLSTTMEIEKLKNEKKMLARSQVSENLPFQPAIQQVNLPHQCSCGERDVLVVFQVAHIVALQVAVEAVPPTQLLLTLQVQLLTRPALLQLHN
ncbi:hypothetical protein Tco_0983676 [Tanacetum coccineum]